MADQEVWAEGNRVIRYSPLVDTAVFYLWVDNIPVSACYVNTVLEYLGISLKALILRFRDPCYHRMWSFLAERMYSERDKYLDEVPYFMEKLGLNHDEACILSLHHVGMGPEAIALFLDVDFDYVRSAFDHIMSAYQSAGIVIDDNNYTKDPINRY